MNAEFIPKAPILIPGKLDESLNRTIGASLREFRQKVKDKMIFGQHTGIIYKKGILDGGGGIFSHQASAKGESPAPETFNLVNSIEIEQTSDSSGIVRINAPYGSILQNKRERDVTKSAEEEYKTIFTGSIFTTVEELT